MGNVNGVGSRTSRQSSRDAGQASPRTSGGGGEAKKSDVGGGDVAWDEESLSKHIREGKLAPQKTGTESPVSSQCVECPICFLYFETVNGSTCCRQPICTGCYVQVRPYVGAVPCPFCSVEHFEAVHDAGIKPSRCSDDGEAKDCETPLKGRSEAYRSEFKEDPPPPVSTPVVSVQDRLKVEEQIREQMATARPL